MHTIVGVTTYNPLSTLRFDLLEETVKSIEKAFPTAELYILSNGSTDHSEQEVNGLCRERWTGIGERWTGIVGSAECLWADANLSKQLWSPGAGRNRLMSFILQHVSDRKKDLGWCLREDPCVVVWSDDDMRWKEGAQQTLETFWSPKVEKVEPEIAILSGLLEPEWHWNTPRRAVEQNGVRVLVRDSAPGAAFSFCNLDHVFPLSVAEATFGYDHKVCKRLAKDGLAVAQIDLAEHLGWGRSTHGNEAIDHVDMRPLDRERWGV